MNLLRLIMLRFKRTHIAFLLLSLVFLLPAAGPAQGYNPGEQFEGKIIKRITAHGLRRIHEEELVDLMTLERGRPFSVRALRTGLRRAFRKGAFIDIRVDAENSEDGVSLTYDVTEVPVVRKVEVKNTGLLLDRDLKKAFYFKRGDTFRKELVPAAKRGLRKFCARQGYPDAEIDIKYDMGEDASSVVLVINVLEGKPALIKRISAPPEAGRVMKLVKYDLLNLDILDRDLERLRNYYRKNGYVGVEVGPFSFRDGILSIPVEKGPKLKVVFVNNYSVKDKELKKVLPFTREGSVNDDVVADAVDVIRKVYRSRGFYDADVAASVEGENEVKVSFFIKEGVRFNVGKFTFQGISIPPSALKRVMNLKEGDPYNDNILQKDITAITAVYKALGFLEAAMKDVRRQPRPEEGIMDLEFVINEGARTMIRDVEVTGNTIISDEELLSMIGLSDDSPFNLIDISDAKLRVLHYYRSRGYAGAAVEIKRSIENDSVRLKFHVSEKHPYRIGKIIIAGNTITKPKIIRRELAFKEGDRYNEDRMLESRRRLYRLGIFNEVSLTTVKTGEEINDEAIVDVLINLRESRPGSVEISLGFGDYEQFRGALDVSYGNLGGYDREVGFKTELSSVERRYVLRFREPWLFNMDNLPFKAYLLKEERRAINIDTRELRYEIDKIGFLAGVERKLTRHITLGLDYEYSFTDTKNVEEGVILSREDQGTLGISSLSPGIYIDTRDNPFDPGTGSFNSIVMKFASNVILSEVNFIKTSFKSAWYYPVHKKVVFALSLRGGVAFNIEETKELPLIERYFLGGRTTVRGFEQDTLGPKGKDDLPTGGNVFGLINAEFRYSLPRGFGLVAFVDGGNVWETFTDINRDLRYTAGAGLRYRTPVGPIRIDYGHKIKKEEGESAGEFHFSFGHAF